MESHQRATDSERIGFRTGAGARGEMVALGGDEMLTVYYSTSQPALF